MHWNLMVLICILGLMAAQSATAQVSVQFLGNTTLVFEDGETVILTDGFLSRPGVGKYVFGVKVETNPDRVDQALKDARVEDADAIFVAHAHFDHAMDVGYVAKKLDAHVYGSRSTRAIAVATGVTSQDVTLLQDRQSYSIGDFSVTALYSPHGDPNRFPGELRTGFQPPARMREYLANENYSFLIQNRTMSALVVPSGNYLEGNLLAFSADIVFLGIGGLNSAHRAAARRGNPEFIGTYWAETVLAVGAKTVVPIHWDNFLVKLTPGEEFKKPPAIVEDFKAVERKLERLARAYDVCLHWMKKPFTRITLGGPDPCAKQ